MGAITGMDDILAGFQVPVQFNKASVASAVAGQLQSLWTAAGYPTAGATPASGSGVACTSATTGSLSIPSLGVGESSYLARIQASFATVGTLVFYDRLVTTSGLVGNVTTSQTVNSAALLRHTSGEGVEMFLEFYTAVGATASNCTVTYTNQAGTGSRTASVVAIASAGAGRMLRVVLQAGDTGVQSVQSVQNSASTGTAGNFGITLMKRIASIGTPLANTGPSFDALALGIPKIQNNTADSTPCLALAVFCSTTFTGFVQGEYVHTVV